VQGEPGENEKLTGPPLVKYDDGIRNRRLRLPCVRRPDAAAPSTESHRSSMTHSDSSVTLREHKEWNHPRETLAILTRYLWATQSFDLLNDGQSLG
jgi:hypothetical protein